MSLRLIICFGVLVASISPRLNAATITDINNRNVACLVGNLNDRGMIPQLYRFVMPEAPQQKLTLIEEKLFHEWLVRTHSTTISYPGAYHHTILHDLRFSWNRNELTVLKLDPVSPVSLIGSHVPRIKYGGWLPKYDRLGRLIESETLVDQLTIANEDQSKPMEFKNSRTDYLIDIDLPVAEYIDCLRKAIEDLQRINP